MERHVAPSSTPPRDGQASGPHVASYGGAVESAIFTITATRVSFLLMPLQTVPFRPNFRECDATCKVLSKSSGALSKSSGAAH